MALYIKANPLVARYLRLTNDRNQVRDGNYLLWQADMLAFGKLTELPQILERIGGISLRAHEARQEQDGTVLRALPTATDKRFVVEHYDDAPIEDANGTKSDVDTEQATESAEDEIVDTNSETEA